MQWLRLYDINSHLDSFIPQELTQFSSNFGRLCQNACFSRSFISDADIINTAFALRLYTLRDMLNWIFLNSSCIFSDITGEQKSASLMLYMNPSNQMHLEKSSASIMEKTSESPNEAGVTKITLDLANMTWEEIQKQWALVDNFSFGQSPQDLDIMKEKSWQIVVITIYSVVILLGFLENLIILCVLLKNKHLHTPTNIFIMGLAISDILLCSFNLPFQLHYQLTERWAFGGALCRVIMPTYGVPIFVSSMSILMIAIDRYMLIVHPFRKRMSKFTAVTMVVSIAFFTIILSVPLIVHTKYEVIDIPAIRVYKEYCVEIWPNRKLRQTYTISTIIIQFFIPLVATSLLYVKISEVLRNRPIKKNERRRNHKTNKILIAIVILFSICWLPWNLLNLMVEFNQKLVSGRYFKLIDLLLKIFAMGSACVNPFLYGWLNDSFRKELNVCVKHPARNRVRQNGHTYTVPECSKTDFNDRYTTIV